MYTTVGLTDNNRYFRYVVALKDGGVYVCVPDYEPTKFGYSIKKYNVHVCYWVGNVEKTLIDFDFSPNDVIACPKFRVGEDYYNEYIKIGTIDDMDINLYCSIRILDENDNLNMNFSTGQGCLYESSPSITWIPCTVVYDNNTCLSCEKLPIEELIKIGVKPELFKYKIKIYVVDDVSCFDRYATEKLVLPEDPNDLEKIPLISILKKVDSYLPGLKLQAVVDTYDENDDIFITFRAVPYILTPDTFARIIADSTDDRWTNPDEEEIENILKNMEIVRPQIYNKTINNIIEVDNTKDSKQHIVQPVFFRVRDLANCVFHPQVTENVCINCDAYKSQVSSFRLKLEGVVFSEIARIKAGIVFKIQGNLLPGQLDEGTYYLLNENGDLVTTGKYTYDY